MNTIAERQILSITDSMESQHESLLTLCDVANAEIKRKTSILKERHNSWSHDKALKSALVWQSRETGTETFSLIERRSFAYRVWYCRGQRSKDYEEVEVVVASELFGWPSTSIWLANMIRDNYDSRCSAVATFCKTTRSVR